MFTKRLLPLLLCFVLLIPLAACQKPETTGSSAPESITSENASEQDVLPRGLTSPLPDAPWGTTLDDVEAAAEKAGAETSLSDNGSFMMLTVPYSVYLSEDGFLGLPYADVNLYTMNLYFREEKLTEIQMYVEAESDQAIVDLLTDVYGEPSSTSLEDWSDTHSVIAEFTSDDTRLEVRHSSTKPASGTPVEYLLWFYAETE